MATVATVDNGWGHQLVSVAPERTSWETKKNNRLLVITNSTIDSNSVPLLLVITHLIISINRHWVITNSKYAQPRLNNLVRGFYGFAPRDCLFVHLSGLTCHRMSQSIWMQRAHRMSQISRGPEVPINELNWMMLWMWSTAKVRGMNFWDTSNMPIQDCGCVQFSRTLLS